MGEEEASGVEENALGLALSGGHMGVHKCQKPLRLSHLGYRNYSSVKHICATKETLQTAHEKSHFLAHTSAPHPQFLQNEQRELALRVEQAQLGGNRWRCFLKCDDQTGPLARQGENPGEALTG